MLNTEASQGHHKSLLVREATAQENKYRIGFPLNVNNVKQNTQENYLFNSVCVCEYIYILQSREKRPTLCTRQQSRLSRITDMEHCLLEDP